VLHGARFSIDGIKMHRRVHGRQQCAMLHMQCNRFIFELAHKIGLQVPLQTWRIQSIEHALQRRLRYSTEEIESWFLEIPDRYEYPLGVLERYSIAPHNSAHFLVVQGFRKGRARRNDKEGEKSIENIRRLGDEVAIPVQDIGRVLQWPQHWPRIVCMNGVR